MGIAVEILDRKRPCYKPATWALHRALAEGGHAIEAHREHFIRKHPAEHDKWYQARLQRFEYKNIAGTIIGEYTGSIFRAALDVMRAKDGDGDNAKRPEMGDYYAELVKDPKGDGEEDLSLLMRGRLHEALVCGESWLMLRMPDSGQQFSSLSEQEAAGDLDVRLCPVDPETVIHYGRDSLGLLWVMLRYKVENFAPLVAEPEGEKPKDRWRWVYMDRKLVRTFECVVDRGHVPAGKDQANEIGAAVTHKLATSNEGRGAVPLICMKLKPELWMMSRVQSLACAETRKRNELAWYESIACIPQLAHGGDHTLEEIAEERGRDKPSRAAQNVWEYEKDGHLGWLEAAGTSLVHLADRLEAMEADIYKAVAQMATAQGAGSSAAVLGRSGASKARDAVAKVILCKQYAQSVRDHAVQVMDLVSAARGEPDCEWEASGCDQHDMVDPTEVATWYATAQAIPTKSQTGKRELEKRYWRELLQGADTGTLDAIEEEVNAADYPDPDELMRETLDADPGPDDPRMSPGKPKPRKDQAPTRAA